MLRQFACHAEATVPFSFPFSLAARPSIDSLPRSPPSGPPPAMDPRLRSIGPRRGVRHRGTRQGPTDCGGRRAPLLGRSVRHRPVPPCPPRFHHRCVDESISRSVHETQDTLGDEASGTGKSKRRNVVAMHSTAFSGLAGRRWCLRFPQVFSTTCCSGPFSNTFFHTCRGTSKTS